MIVLILLSICLFAGLVLGPWLPYILLGIIGVFVLGSIFKAPKNAPYKAPLYGRAKEKAEQEAERRRMLPTLYGPEGRGGRQIYGP